MKITSDNFIKYFKRGKEAALEYVIETFIGIVKAVVHHNYKISNDPQLMEECISDTFLGAFENARQFKGDADDFKKWLCTIAKFKTIDKVRKLSRSPKTLELTERDYVTGSAEDAFFSKEATVELLHLMSELEQIDRDIFTMKYFLDMGNQEIADQLQLSKAAVDNRLYRGKKKLRACGLGGMFHEKTI